MKLDGGVGSVPSLVLRFAVQKARKCAGLAPVGGAPVRIEEPREGSCDHGGRIPVRASAEVQPDLEVPGRGFDDDRGREPGLVEGLDVPDLDVVDQDEGMGPFRADPDEVLGRVLRSECIERVEDGHRSVGPKLHAPRTAPLDAELERVVPECAKLVADNGAEVPAHGHAPH